ncbi:hypothetical protein LAZ67_X002877 [Cordylochernes scorpioides]|uniref:Reverse transcriptase domain-containing protein n=1 Tax=Cordylochernes scorpioides TaxID=51811 RepID=A0ABY6LUR6_9ARAC|nr:hypothetical protein LAZ67_X002877 [Cordylochernes scorpioides]
MQIRPRKNKNGRSKLRPRKRIMTPNLSNLYTEKKRKRLNAKSQRAQIVRPDASSPKPSGQLRMTTKESVTFVGNTRQQQAAEQAATYDQCCYVEWCADFHPVHYMKALEELLGKRSIYQLMKMSGHVMVGLASIEKAERLVENGLTINNHFLRTFPYRRKAEKIILGNLPIAVREEDIIEALRPYCRVVSLAYEVVSCNGYTWTTGNREAFVLLNEGRKLHQLPAKLVIISKGESTPAYITYGVRISVGTLLRRLKKSLGRDFLVAYADDIVLFIRDDAQFELISLILEEFQVASETPTVDVPHSIPWVDLRRNCFSGHDADIALRLAFLALPHPEHPTSESAICTACGSSDGSLTHKYWIAESCDLCSGRGLCINFVFNFSLRSFDSVDRLLVYM